MSEIQYVGGDLPVGTDVQDLRINVLVPQSEREKVLDNFYEYRTNGKDARAMDKLAKVERRQKDGFPKEEYEELDDSLQPSTPLRGAKKVESSDLTNLMGLHSERMLERFTSGSGSATNSLDKVYIDETNKNTQKLSTNELEIITKNNAIHELEESTDKTYKAIFSISMFIFTIVILAVLTLAKSLAGLSDSVYMSLVTVIVVGYLLYILYLFNAFYVKDSVDKLARFIRTGQFELKTIEIGNLNKKTYIQEQCRKKKELGYYDTDEGAYEEDPGSANDLLARLDKNNRHYYNDGNSPKQQIYPTKFDSNQYIVYPDYDSTTRGTSGQRVKTSGL